MDDKRKQGIGRLQTIMEEGQSSPARMNGHNNNNNNSNSNKNPDGIHRNTHQHQLQGNKVPSLCIQPGTPGLPSSSAFNTTTTTRHHLAAKDQDGGKLPALSSSRSLISGGRPSPSPQPSPRLFHKAQQGFEPKGSLRHINGQGMKGQGLQFGHVAAASGFQKTDMNSRAYGPQIIPLGSRTNNNNSLNIDNNTPPNNTSPGQNYGHSPKQIPIKKHPPGLHNNNSHNLILATSNMAVVSGAGNSEGEPSLFLPLQTLQTHTPTPSEVSNITTRSVTTPRDSLHTPRSLHVFLEPLPKTTSDWPHFKRLPSLPSNSNDSIGSEVDQSLHLVGGSSGSGSGGGGGGGASHHHHYLGSASNLSPNQALDFSPFLTTPRHSANGHCRTSQKRALSISPSLSEGLDLSQLIRMSPTSLAFLNNSNSQGSLTPLSPQLGGGGQQGSFSHMPVVQPRVPGAGEGGEMDQFAFSGAPPEEEMDGGSYLRDFMISNACVARQSDMPFIENSYIQGGFPPHLGQTAPVMAAAPDLPHMTFTSQGHLMCQGQHPNLAVVPAAVNMMGMQTSPPYSELMPPPPSPNNNKNPQK
ncbi:hypothetical protein ACOMHN_006487 [Nucella lapillus]